MKAASQGIVGVTSFLVVFLLGNFFDAAFLQVSHRAHEILQGKPLPNLTQFLADHHHLATWLPLFPWLWLIGAPLLSRQAARNYWDPAAFVLRFLAFVCCEVLLLLMGLLALFLPFVTYYSVLQSGGVQSRPEQVAESGFWLCVVLIPLAAINQVRSNRTAASKSKNG